MITKEEKMEIVINLINNINAMIKSFTDNAEICKDKYSLEDELAACNIKKSILLDILRTLEAQAETLD